MGGSWASGRIISYLGTRRSLYVGYITAALEQLFTGLSRVSAHFYGVRVLQLTSDVSTVAMQYAPPPPTPPSMHPRPPTYSLCFRSVQSGHVSL